MFILIILMPGLELPEVIQSIAESRLEETIYES